MIQCCCFFFLGVSCVCQFYSLPREAKETPQTARKLRGRKRKLPRQQENFDDGKWIGTSLLLNFGKGKTHIQVKRLQLSLTNTQGRLSSSPIASKKTMFWMVYSSQRLWKPSLGLYCLLTIQRPPKKAWWKEICKEYFENWWVSGYIYICSSW
jgi:hypothetical protein